ncbi:hypothetical protein SI65_05288 [Aspergillus cristatus]|uniref:Uncharacterized protein n=1 Tax=Aspergillus cristatus TaxID=573508 RepID=A0A1E3BD13_ASPCR|nr:hypothetical protein SI65_05288 [Aspergillus cristatus]
MVQVNRYYLPPTKLIPNSPQPLLHYKGLFSESDLRPETIHTKFNQNGWKTQWIFRYGPTQQSRYHSAVPIVTTAREARAHLALGTTARGGKSGETEATG